MGCKLRVWGLGHIPVAEKMYLFQELYIETIIRNPKKLGLFGYRLGL